MSMGSRSLGQPTAEQSRRWDAMRSLGCLTCWMRDGMSADEVTEIHHLTLGGKHGAPRLGHDYTVALCRWCHRGVRWWGNSAEEMETHFGPSYARTPRAFRREYGDDQHLLDTQQDRLWLPRAALPSRRDKAQPLRDERGTSEVSKTTQRKRKGSARGTHCQRPEGALPRRYTTR